MTTNRFIDIEHKVGNTTFRTNFEMTPDWLDEATQLFKDLDSLIPSPAVNQPATTNVGTVCPKCGQPMKPNKDNTYLNCTKADWKKGADGKWNNYGCRGSIKL